MSIFSSLNSESTQRPVRLRRRPDLDVQRIELVGQSGWLVKDPIALRYYRFADEEFALLEMLDGQISLHELQRRFAERFAPQQMAVAEIHRLLSMLYRCSLVVADAPGQGEQILRRTDSQSKNRWLKWLANPLCLRFRGINPNWLLGLLCSVTGWFFTAPAVVLVLAFVLVSALMAFSRIELVLAELPDFHQFFSVENGVLFASVLAITKVLHELGHGIACKRLGGECHELGFMVFAFTPCLYCNVSDAWMLTNKWHRAAIAAAGMYVELFLAAVAMWVWRFSEPGLVRDLALGVMFTSSLSTLVFNANPLMKYDGYFILCDLLETPNLRHRAAISLHGMVGNWLFHSDAVADKHESAAKRRPDYWLALYAVASYIYSMSVMLAVVVFLYHVLEPYGAKLIGQLLVIATIGGTMMTVAREAYIRTRTPGWLDRLNLKRTSVVLVVGAMLPCGALLVPMPHRVQAPASLIARNAALVYVAVPGTIREIYVVSGQHVKADEPLLQLENPQLELDICRLEGEHNALTAKFESEKKLAQRDRSEYLAALEQSVETVRERLDQRRNDLAKLVIRAPRDGQIMLTTKSTSANGSKGGLRTWRGSPLDKSNLGAYLEEATCVCRIGDSQQVEALLRVDQNDLDTVRAGQVVDIVAEQLPGTSYRGTIRQVAALDMDLIPPRETIQAGGELEARLDARGHHRLTSTRYEASVEFDEPRRMLVFDSRATAKIHVGYRTLASRALTVLFRLFNFEL